MLRPASYSSYDVTTTVVISAYVSSKLIHILASVRPNAYDVQHIHCVGCEVLPHEEAVFRYVYSQNLHDKLYYAIVNNEVSFKLAKVDQTYLLSKLI